MKKLCYKIAMKNHILSTLLFLLCASVAHALPAYPGAVGFGSDTVHGSGRHLGTPATTVYKVTNLNDSGSGSLRACAEASGPRVCVFETSGTIPISSTILVSSPYLYIAGATAPDPGILVKGCGIRVSASDVMIKHISIRPGDSLTPSSGSCAPDTRDALNITASTSLSDIQNVLIDHVSLAWAVDDIFSTYQDAGRTLQNITLSHALLYEGLSNSVHTTGTPGDWQEHSKGTLHNADAVNITYFQVALAHAKDRMIRTKNGSTIELINFIGYNWGGTSNSNVFNISDSSGTDSFYNVIKNLWKRGPDSPVSYGTAMYAQSGQLNSGTRIYVLGNLTPSRTADSGSEWTGVVNTLIPESPNRTTSPAFTGSGASSSAVAAASLLDIVLGNAGSRPRSRLARDITVVNDIKNGTGQIIDCVTTPSPRDGSTSCPKNAGGWPTLAVNTRTFTVPANQNEITASGYTVLEEKLQAYDAEVEPNPPILLSVKAKRLDRRQ